MQSVSSPLEKALLAAGSAGLVAAFLLRPSDALSAAGQVWPAFVIVAGLLLIGLVAQQDGLFAYAGVALAHRVRTGWGLLIGASLLITVVTATLNLDTAMVFLTPVFVALARASGSEDSPLVYLCLLLANAGSLFLPGSNLTNLIVLGHDPGSGGAFLASMWPAATAAVVATVAVVAWKWRGRLAISAPAGSLPPRPAARLGLVSVVVALGVVLAVREPAPAVLAIGVVSVGTRILSGQESWRHAVGTLGLPTLIGLFGLAVALGTLGRSWSGPLDFLVGLGALPTMAAGAAAALLINNLPAAALLSAQPPPDPLALLVGLNIGPNLFVTGSLAWFLWLRSAVLSGASPSIARATRLGLWAVPAALGAAGAALVLVS